MASPIFGATLLLHLGSLCWLPVALSDPPAPPAAPTVRLSIAVAEQGGAPVQTPAWLRQQLAELARIYNNFGIYFHEPRVRALAEAHAALETRADRDALAAELEKGHLNVFVVGSLRDVDDPDLYRMGVHWAPNGDLSRHYVIVAAGAQRSTLAHEVGHFFTLPHLFVPDNLMSYQRTGERVFLNAQQKATALAHARVLFARKQLVP